MLPVSSEEETAAVAGKRFAESLKSETWVDSGIATKDGTPYLSIQRIGEEIAAADAKAIEKVKKIKTSQQAVEFNDWEWEEEEV